MERRPAFADLLGFYFTHVHACLYCVDEKVNIERG